MYVLLWMTYFTKECPQWLAMLWYVSEFPSFFKLFFFFFHFEPLHQPYFCEGFFEIGELFPRAGFKPWSSWSLPPDYRCELLAPGLFQACKVSTSSTFLSWQTFGLFPSFGYCDQYRYEHECTNLFKSSVFNPFGPISRSGVTVSYGILFLISWGAFITFSTAAAAFYSPTSSAQGFQFLHIPKNAFLCC
jgi:hypothetical protein